MVKTEINWLKKIWEALTDLVSARGSSGGSGGSQPVASQPTASESDNSNSGSSDVMHVYGTVGQVIEFAGIEDLYNETDGFIPDEDSPTYEEAEAWFSAGKTVIMHVRCLGEDLSADINSLPAPSEVKQAIFDSIVADSVVTNKSIKSDATGTVLYGQPFLSFDSCGLTVNWYATELIVFDLSEYLNEVA